MDFRLLGPLEVLADDAPVQIGAGKQSALLAVLLLNANRTVSREQLIDALWGDAAPESAQKMVQILVSQLRKLLPEPRLRTRAPGYVLEVGEDELDLMRFERLLAFSRDALSQGEAARASALLREALALWRGPAIAEFAEPFAQHETRRLEELRVAALECRIEAEVALGHSGEVVGELDSLIARYPLRERLRSLHMLALYQSGRSAEALAGYREFRRTLADELGIEPTAALKDLERRMLRQDPELEPPSARPSVPAMRSVRDGDSASPGLDTGEARPNNLPPQTSEFLGREIQLTALHDLLDADGVRLLTLIGPGGIGKTRLALEAAAHHIEHFEHGIYFVDLSPVRDRDNVFQAIIQAVDVSATTDEPPLAVLTQELRSRRLLLLLDNFEHVMEAADGVAELLRHCPGLKVLVTSREALRVRGEHLFTVPPLALPAAGETAAELVAGYEAIRLFVERARQVQPGFVVTSPNAAAVAEICARLDGLPLAIELAAARLTLFSPDELRDRLDRRLDVLLSGARDLPARQQTLRGTIEWSYDLLEDDERALFRILSVFVTARLDAVEEVAARLQLGRRDFVESLASLIDKSLVRSTDEGGQRRLSMLETIREYATERLDEDADLAEEVRRGHAEYFCEFTQSRRHRLYGPDRGSMLDELGAELGNLTAAWRYWVDAGEPERLNALLDGLWVLNEVRGWYHATIELANDLLGVLSAVPSTPARLREEIALRTSLARGLLATRGYTEEAEQTYDRALALAEQTGDVPQRAPVVRSLASFYFYRGDFERAAALGRELVALAEERGDTSIQVDGELVLGASVAFQGDVPTGIEHLERAIALFDPRQHLEGFRFGTSPGAVAYSTLALFEWLRGHPDRSAELSGHAIDLASELKHPFSTAYIVFHTAVLDLWRRELAFAHARAGRVWEVAEEHGYQIWKALALMLQGSAAAGLGRPEEGVECMERGLDLYQGLTTPSVFWPLVLSIRGQGFAHAGRPHDGLPVIEEAIETVGVNAVLYPGFALLKSELLIALADTKGAVAELRKVVDAARRLGLRAPLLRAATMLVRLGQEDAVELLRTVYDTFTEGFGDADLVDARVALAARDVVVG
jgi:predicted ATPase/DNA-binding SARP family transcriptional activator